jgi:rhamnulokinase
VIAGPVEASALGNILVQAIALGELGSLAEAHAVARASSAREVYEPGRDRGRAEAIYGRFLDAIASAPPAPMSIERI